MVSPYGIAFVCKEHGTDATRMRVALRFKSRRPRKMWCGVCEARTWWVSEDALIDELTTVVRQRASGSGGLIFVHRRWIGRRVRIVPVEA